MLLGVGAAGAGGGRQALPGGAAASPPRHGPHQLHRGAPPGLCPDPRSPRPSPSPANLPGSPPHPLTAGAHGRAPSDMLVEKLADGFQFIEGPVWVRGRRLPAFQRSQHQLCPDAGRPALRVPPPIRIPELPSNFAWGDEDGPTLYLNGADLALPGPARHSGHPAADRNIRAASEPEGRARPVPQRDLTRKWARRFLAQQPSSWAVHAGRSSPYEISVMRVACTPCAIR